MSSNPGTTNDIHQARSQREAGVLHVRVTTTGFSLMELGLMLPFSTNTQGRRSLIRIKLCFSLEDNFNILTTKQIYFQKHLRDAPSIYQSSKSSLCFSI